MAIECPHDAAHVDALLAGIQTDGTCDRRFQRQVAIVAAVKPDGQAEV